MSSDILRIDDLTVAFQYDGKPIPVTRNVSLNIKNGEILGIVGESGSGKSVTAKTITRLLPSPPSSVLSGAITLDGINVLDISEKEMQHLRGNTVSMIFQEPMTSLNPVFTCGYQLMEGINRHQGLSNREAYNKAIEMLRAVSIPMPDKRMKAYPHEMSGGMRQRVMIAMAIACNPKLLIADEPTTALDPTIQAQIIDLILRIQKERGMSVMYITHDLGVVAETCERVVVLYAGMVMEIADVKELFNSPRHPYTAGLLKAIPKMGEKKVRLYDIKGTVPNITQRIAGCPFHTRCPIATQKCRVECPDITDMGNGHKVRCFHAVESREGGI